MNRFVEPSTIGGFVRAPSSKSSLQRALACAALTRGVSEILNATWSADSLAACGIAEALGAVISRGADRAVVRGIPPTAFGEAGGPISASCRESGTALRMFSAAAALFAREVVLSGEGTLARRPVGAIEAPLRSLGAECSTAGGLAPVRVRGPLRGGRVRVDGSGSSQFLSGLLTALPLAPEDSVLEVERLVSRGYVDLTLDVIRAFGARAERSPDYSEFRVPGGQAYEPTVYKTEGDWSGAAFLLVAGALAAGDRPVEITGLDPASSQPDRAILDALGAAGAAVESGPESIRVRASPLRSFRFDATDCPDLFPPLAALAAFCGGRTILKGAGRLRAKESDRAAALSEEFAMLGVRIEVEADEMIVHGGSAPDGKPPGGTVDSRGDHRIAMAAAVAALACSGPVEIRGAQCVSKSYPAFFEDLASLGARLE